MASVKVFVAASPWAYTASPVATAVARLLLAAIIAAIAARHNHTLPTWLSPSTYLAPGALGNGRKRGGRREEDVRILSLQPKFDQAVQASSLVNPPPACHYACGSNRREEEQKEEVDC